MKKKIALVSMLFFVFFCKEENKEVPKQENSVQEEKVQNMKTEYVFNGVYSMDDMHLVKDLFGLKTKFKEYCLRIDLKANVVELGILEGKIYKGKILEKDAESVTIEINSASRRYFLLTYEGLSGSNTYALMTDDYSEKKSDGKWSIDSAAGAEASSQTIQQCISTSNLKYELQYHEEDHSVPKKK
ncbi:hypothetical protein [Leptospira borgpetersenii]|uniref:hypothetical protein n=1 Tax=Leptospira borgpetersenii TaxID=174 RepID=UPI000774D240|nr:hypothetical protein [Leptospira borgpetersenii]MBE8401008.1 hypothetical protein [Leptospira borgpetersenii serovar Tarassovi]MBE8403091.1 hypothetical protein [Leptospira borgpetersenii serovar Tarassovi]MBE8406093.1 hypothetical protein [Leptospira borgpetersenii serovar Tarassovi]MBE8414028.1 hypothetical protein [Leptospira borgpetersenii serovar Tarassovi]MBE8414375.1 hypothetical protein [Leptospira borgpetersenii serovar Tarassovi]